MQAMQVNKKTYSAKLILPVKRNYVTEGIHEVAFMALDDRLSTVVTAMLTAQVLIAYDYTIE